MGIFPFGLHGAVRPVSQARFLRQVDLTEAAFCCWRGSAAPHSRVPIFSFPCPSCSAHLTRCWIHSGVFSLFLLVLTWFRKGSALMMSVLCPHSKWKGFVGEQSPSSEKTKLLVTFGGYFVKAQSQWTCVKWSWGNASMRSSSGSK